MNDRPNRIDRSIFDVTQSAAVRDVTAAAQFFDALKDLSLKPEINLLLGILQDAVNCIRKTNRRAYQEKNRQEAIQWCFSDAEQSVFDFIVVCYGLGLEPETVRKHLREVINESEKEGAEKGSAAAGLGDSRSIECSESQNHGNRKRIQSG